MIGRISLLKLTIRLSSCSSKRSNLQIELKSCKPKKVKLKLVREFVIVAEVSIQNKKITIGVVGRINLNMEVHCGGAVDNLISIVKDA